MNSSSFCNFTSINDFLTSSEAGGVNITHAVANCSRICSQAWGNGNADLSGIGVNISYIIQVVLTILFGPVFALVYGLRDKLRLNGNRLAKLQDGFLDASAQFSIPVAIATVVRLKQSAPLYEITFLQSLTSMQFLALLSTSVATGIVGIKSKSWKRVVVIVLYSLIDFGLYMALVGYLRTSKASWESLKELSKACNAYGTNLLPGFVYFQTNNPFPHITAKEYFTPFNKKGGKFAGILIGFVTAGVVGLILLFGIVVGLVMIFVEQSALGLGLLSLGLSAGMIYFTTQMENKRTHMKRILGAEFQDDQWGFGQVLALCLWVPLLLQSLLAILEILSRPNKGDVPNAATDPESNQEKQQPPVQIEDSTATDPKSNQEKQQHPVQNEDATATDAITTPASVGSLHEAHSTTDGIEDHKRTPPPAVTIPPATAGSG